MPGLASLYFPAGVPDLESAFPGVETDAVAGGKATWFRLRVGPDAVTFTVCPQAELKGQLAGLTRWVRGLDEEPKRIAHAVGLIAMATGMLGMRADRTFDDNHALWALLFQVADRCDGFVFAYDSVILPNGAVLVGSLREEDKRAHERAACDEADAEAEAASATADQLERRERNMARVASLGLPTLRSLPCSPDQASVVARGKDAVVARCLASLCCAIRGETNDKAWAERTLASFGATEALSPEEAAFMALAEPPSEMLSAFSWGYEHAHVFMWALGYVTELATPEAMADVPALARILSTVVPRDFGKGAKLRSLREVLDAADFYYRLHWAAVELRLDGQEHEALDEGVVQERHRALNWLTSESDQAWDDIATHT